MRKIVCLVNTRWAAFDFIVLNVRWATEKHADSIPAPDVHQLTSDEVLKTACEAQICIISILPNILDCQSQCRNKYLATLKELGEKYKKQQWG